LKFAPQVLIYVNQHWFKKWLGTDRVQSHWINDDNNLKHIDLLPAVKGLMLSHPSSKIGYFCEMTIKIDTFVRRNCFVFFHLISSIVWVWFLAYINLIVIFFIAFISYNYPFITVDGYTIVLYIFHLNTPDVRKQER